MPSEYAVAPVRRAPSSTSPQHLVDARVGQARHRGERAQVLAPRAARVGAADLEVGADRAAPAPRRRASGLAADRRRARRRPGEAEHHAQRGRLARAVGPEEARDGAGADA